jgi:hypothetical protein
MSHIQIGHVEASCHDGCWEFRRSGYSATVISIDRSGGLCFGEREICQPNGIRAVQIIAEKSWLGECGSVAVYQVCLVLNDNRVTELPHDIGNFGSDFLPARAFATLLASAMKTQVENRTDR